MLLLLCLSVLLKPLFPVVEYAANYQYIANELCENQDKVEMGCNGKCYLMKQMAKEAESEKPLSSNKKHAPETTDLYFVGLNESANLQTISIQSSSESPYRNRLFSDAPIGAFFHPPTALS